MPNIRSIFFMAGLTLAATSAFVAPASAQNRWDWGRGGPEDRRDYGLAGPGVRLLLPELRDTRRGQAFVMRNFDLNRDGLIDPREARAANRAFLEVAGRDRRHFDWDHPGPGVDAGPPREPGPASGAWDRQGMRNYHFHQGRYGAMFTLKDVLFQTASAALRPGVEAQLRPLADYLHAHPRVQVRIDGFTDSVGSDASNLVLSRDRAKAVAQALAAMDISPARFQSDGHGKANPVAANDTAEGRQLNRRVEVTLVGQRATTFN
jgi:outer membrane protein OmpA-like peptidoglycan-associated protein